MLARSRTMVELEVASLGLGILRAQGLGQGLWHVMKVAYLLGIIGE